MSFKFNTSNIASGLNNLQNKQRAALGLYSDTASKKMENYAKSNYTWKDQTYQASRRLNGDWEWKGNSTRLSISQGVDYGLWLEVRFGGKYAICKPTIINQGPLIVKGLQNLLK